MTIELMTAPTAIETIVTHVESRKLDGELPGPVDPGALTGIFGDDIAAKLAIWQKFAIQTTQIVSNFEAAYMQRDADKISFHTHKLKSSARVLGANHLADLCFDLELAGRNADWGAIDNLFMAMRPAWERVKDYIDGL
jgi:hypothetical protein